MLSHQWSPPFAPVFRPVPGGMPASSIPMWDAEIRAGRPVRISDPRRARRRTGEPNAPGSSRVRSSPPCAYRCSDASGVVGFLLVDDDRTSERGPTRTSPSPRSGERNSPPHANDPKPHDVDWASLLGGGCCRSPSPRSTPAGQWVYANRLDARDRPPARAARPAHDRSFLADISAADSERLRTVLRPVVEGQQASTATTVELWGRLTEARFLRVPPTGEVRAVLVAVTPTGPVGPIDDIDVVAALAAGWVRRRLPADPRPRRRHRRRRGPGPRTTTPFSARWRHRSLVVERPSERGTDPGARPLRARPGPGRPCVLAWSRHRRIVRSCCP